MAGAPETVFTEENIRAAEEARKLILSAASRCVESGCSAAKYFPDKIGDVVKKGTIRLDTAEGIAAKLVSCAGLFEETLVITPEKIDEETGIITPQQEITVDMCHLPQHVPSAE